MHLYLFHHGELADIQLAVAFRQQDTRFILRANIQLMSLENNYNWLKIRAVYFLSEIFQTDCFVDFIHGHDK